MIKVMWLLVLVIYILANFFAILSEPYAKVSSELTGVNVILILHHIISYVVVVYMILTKIAPEE